MAPSGWTRVIVEKPFGKVNFPFLQTSFSNNFLTMKSNVSGQFSPDFDSNDVDQDSDSSADLSLHLQKLFSEDQLYRIDHYLGNNL